MVLVNLVVLKNPGEVAQFSKTELFREGRYRLITTTPDASLECEVKDIPYAEIENYQSFDDIERINTATHRLSEGWWKEESIKKICPELSSYCGITPGHALGLAFYHVISEAVRSVIIAERLIATEKPDTILMYRNSETRAGGPWVGFWLSLKTDAIELVASRIGVPVNLHKAVHRRSYVVTRMRRLASRGKSLIKSLLNKKSHDEHTFGSSDEFKGKMSDGCSRILVYAEGRHADAIWPLLEKIIQDTNLCMISLTQDMSMDCISRIKRSGGDLFDPISLWTETLSEQVKKDFDAISGRWEEISNVPYLLAIGEKDIGISIWPLVRFQFQWLFEQGMHELFKRIYLARRTLESIRPDLLLMPVDSSINDICWVLTAQSLGIPSMTPLHGTLYAKPAKNRWGVQYSDKTAVWGPLTRDWEMEITGRSAENFACAGFPIFETYAERYRNIKAEDIYAKLGLAKDKPIVLFLVSMASGAIGSYYQSQFRIYDAFFKEMSKMPEAQIIVRTHPASDPRIPELYIKKNKLRCLINPPSELMPLIKIADVIVGQPTTAMLDVMIVGKPYLFFNVMISRDLTWGFENGVFSVNEPSHLIPAINSILNDESAKLKIIKDQENYLSKIAGPIDGHASQRTIDFIKNIIQKDSGHESKEVGCEYEC